MPIRRPYKKLNLLAMTTERSAYIQANFAILKTILLASFIVFIVLSAFAFYKIITRPNPPVYAYNEKGTSRLIRLNLPKISNEALMRWASQAISDIYTFNFIQANLDAHIKDIQAYFTKDGYTEFMDSASELINDARISQLSYKANSCDVVSIRDSFTVSNDEGANTVWLVEIPLIMYIEGKSGDKGNRLERFVITATIEGGNNVREDKSIALTSIRMARGNDSFCKVPNR